MNAQTIFQADPSFDVACDATREWREACIEGEHACFEECEDTAQALFCSDWEPEPRGADDCGPLREVFDLIGLRITTPTGAVVVINRRDALDALGPVAVAALERAMADAANDE